MKGKPKNCLSYLQYEEMATNYLQDAKDWLDWIKNATEVMYEKEIPTNSEELTKLLNQLDKFKREDLPPMWDERERLRRVHSELVHAFEGTNILHVPEHLQPPALDDAWQELEKAMQFRYEVLDEQLGIQVIIFYFLQFFRRRLPLMSCPSESSKH